MPIAFFDQSHQALSCFCASSDSYLASRRFGNKSFLVVFFFVKIFKLTLYLVIYSDTSKALYCGSYTWVNNKTFLSQEFTNLRFLCLYE